MSHPFIDETGNIYGKLTVVERAVNAKSGKTRWLCRCACGNATIVDGRHLRDGSTKSCGCLMRLAEGEAAFNKLWGEYRRSARKRHIAWKLSREQFRTLTSLRCYYCGTTPSRKMEGAGYNGFYIYNGIDRKDSNQGYLYENVLPCCWQCNRMKGSLGHDEFLAVIGRIWEYRIMMEG